MESFKQWLNESNKPAVLYHFSHRKNREGILQNGLQGSKFDQSVPLDEPGVIGGTFFTNNPKREEPSNSDIWEVDVSGLEVEDDWSTSVPAEAPEWERWYVIYQDIPPSRIKLIS